MEVSDKLHATVALHPGKEPMVPIGEKFSWAPDPVWARRQREKIPSHA